jgi:hypothetical protein
MCCGHDLLSAERKWHAFLLGFLTCQGIAWLIEILLVEWRLVAYPVREFPHASDFGITEKLMLYPVLCAFFVIYEPSKRYWVFRLMNLTLWVAGLTIIDVSLAHYTRILDYIGFRWFHAALFFLGLLLSVKSISYWFFHLHGNSLKEKKSS